MQIAVIYMGNVILLLDFSGGTVFGSELNFNFLNECTIVMALSSHCGRRS